jgi:predicted outer membrane repeat protein
VLDRVSVLGNKANYGGGLFMWASPRSSLSATNTTIGGNQATQNGGGIQTGGDLRFDFVTLAGNKAQGGRNLLFDGGSVVFSNSLIAGSADNSCANADAVGDIQSGGFNIDQGQSCLLTVDTNGDGVPDAPAADDRINVPDTALNLIAPNTTAASTGSPSVRAARRRTPARTSASRASTSATCRARRARAATSGPSSRSRRP